MTDAKSPPARPARSASASTRSPSFADVTLGLILALPLLLLVALVLLFPERAQYVVDLGEAIAWPLAVLLAVIAFRAVIPDLARGLGGRIKGISIPPITLELVTVAEVAPTWTVFAPTPTDVRGPTPAHIFDAPTGLLFDQLSDATPADYAVVDLGAGEEWATSRLFIFAVILQGLRGLQCFVFVESTVAGRGQWVGIATPDDVRRVLGGLYPWFERALGAAYGSVSMQLSPTPTSPPAIGMQSSFARDLVRAFLEHPEIQRTHVDPVAPWPPEGEEWLPADPATSLWEHGGWIDGDRLIKDLEPVLNREVWVAEVAGEREAMERAIIGREGQFVGIVGNGWRFHRLVDRVALLERISTQLEAGA